MRRLKRTAGRTVLAGWLTATLAGWLAPKPCLPRADALVGASAAVTMPRAASMMMLRLVIVGTPRGGVRVGTGFRRRGPYERPAAQGVTGETGANEAALSDPPIKHLDRSVLPKATGCSLFDAPQAWRIS